MGVTGSKVAKTKKLTSLSALLAALFLCATTAQAEISYWYCSEDTDREYQKSYEEINSLGFLIKKEYNYKMYNQTVPLPINAKYVFAFQVNTSSNKESYSLITRWKTNQFGYNYHGTPEEGVEAKKDTIKFSKEEDGQLIIDFQHDYCRFSKSIFGRTEATDDLKIILSNIANTEESAQLIITRDKGVSKKSSYLGGKRKKMTFELLCQKFDKIQESGLLPLIANVTTCPNYKNNKNDKEENKS